MKYALYLGLFFASALIAVSFLPWAYYPDIGETFTGFYSRGNIYGRPGKTFVFLAACSIVLLLIPRLWAKRVNQFIGILIIVFAIKAFVLFSACYAGTCPQKLFGLYAMLVAAGGTLMGSLLSGSVPKQEPAATIPAGNGNGKNR